MQRAERLTSALALVAVLTAVGCGRAASTAWSTGHAAPRAAYVDQFDTLWNRFDAVYPSFAYKQIDWSAQRARYRARAERARSQNELVSILIEMLAPLRDRHVWLVDPRGQVVPTFRSASFLNFDRQRWESMMRQANVTTRNGIGEGRVGGFAYMFVDTWLSPVTTDALDTALERARDADGLIIDLRTNAGGNDFTARAFAARFTQRVVPASFVSIKGDALAGEAEAPFERRLSPRGSWQFVKPVVILSGRGGLSATETFVAAMRTLPQVTVIGDTTGGSSGNPATFTLGNGWKFSVPRWLEYGPDRQPIEGRGVAPHLTMAWEPEVYLSDRDPLIDAAVGVLAERTGAFRTTATGEPESLQREQPDK